MGAGLGSTLWMVTKMPLGCTASSCKALGLKSIPADLILVEFQQLLIQTAWRGPWCPHQLPQMLPSVLVPHEFEQLPDVLSDDLPGLPQVVLQRVALIELVAFLLIELLEGVSV